MIISAESFLGILEIEKTVYSSFDRNATMLKKQGIQNAKSWVLIRGVQL